MSVTHHGYERGKQRLGFSKKTLDRMTERALKRGLTVGDTNGRLRRYLDALFFKYHNGNLRLYAEHVFVFTKNDTLITVFRVPNSLRTRTNSLCKDKSQNGKEERSTSRR